MGVLTALLVTFAQIWAAVTHARRCGGSADVVASSVILISVRFQGSWSTNKPRRTFTTRAPPGDTYFLRPGPVCGFFGSVGSASPAYMYDRQPPNAIDVSRRIAALLASADPAHVVRSDKERL